MESEPPGAVVGFVEVKKEISSRPLIADGDGGVEDMEVGEDNQSQLSDSSSASTVVGSGEASPVKMPSPPTAMRNGEARSSEGDDKDEDRPTIFVRNFAEIAERDSDDEEDIVFIEEIDTTKSKKLLKGKNLRGPMTAMTFDDSLASLDMTVSEEVDDVITQYFSEKMSIFNQERVSFLKISKALLERNKLREKRASSISNQMPQQPLIRMTPSAPSLNNGFLESVLRPARPPQVLRQVVPGIPVLSSIPRGPIPIRFVRPVRGSRPGLAGNGFHVPPRPSTSVGDQPTISLTTTDEANNVVTIPISHYQIVHPPSPSSLVQVSTGQQKQLIPPGYGYRGLAPDGMTVRLASSSHTGMMMGNPNQQTIRWSPNVSLLRPPHQQYQGSQSPLSSSSSAAPRNQIVDQYGRLMSMQSSQVEIRPVFQQQQQRPQGPRKSVPIRSGPPLPQQQQQRIASSAIPPIPSLKTYAPKPVSRATPPPPAPTATATLHLRKENVGKAPVPMPMPMESEQPKQVTAGTQLPIPGTVEEPEVYGAEKKTFPSLVVQVKSHLQPKESQQAQRKSKATLDSKVKNQLWATPAKFIEWMMRRGLLKIEHRCLYVPHHVEPLKLGIYSDPSKQPYTGGYIWTSDCCPGREVSVFKGSIFEGSKYPPGHLYKLIYHWACQTCPENVLQWVKVTSLYLKNFYALLRAVCICWLHENCPMLGGDRKFVEIGVITLGGTADTSRGVKSVKVEILGAFDPANKMVRLKVINVLNGNSKDKSGNFKGTEEEQGARAFQILWALAHWVDKRSTLLVDEIIDKTLFRELGFTKIVQGGIQTTTTMKTGGPTNANVMRYLKDIVPKIFSTTLTVLSKSLIQQFLDELCWREQYGGSMLRTFDSMIDQVVGITKWDTCKDSMSLITRLGKAKDNPFIDWSLTKQTQRSPLNTIPLSLRNKPGIRECIQYIMMEKDKVAGDCVASSTSQKRKLPEPSVGVGEAMTSRDSEARRRKVEYYVNAPKEHNLERFYYGRTQSELPKSWSLCSVTLLKCPMCPKTFSKDNRDIIRHTAMHVKNLPKTLEPSLCQYCFHCPTPTVPLHVHKNDMHYFVKAPFVCQICEYRFQTEMDLTIHMWELHVEAEAPYVCHVCDFSSSFHPEVVDHFERVHGDIPYVMCPCCLEVLAAKSHSNLNSIAIHLRSHQPKRVLKCPKCVLTFPRDSDFKRHLESAHSSKNGNYGSTWKPYNKDLPYRQHHPQIMMATPPVPPLATNPTRPFSSTVTQQPPQQKKRKVSGAGNAVLVLQNKKNVTSSAVPVASLNAPFVLPIPVQANPKFGGSRFKINVPKMNGKRAICFECNEDIYTPDHFVGNLSCNKCRYSTACEAAMNLHHETKHDNPPKATSASVLALGIGKKIKKRVQPLAKPLVCTCGFLSANPDELAEHLAQCEKYTVFPLPADTDQAVINDDDDMEIEVPRSPTAVFETEMELGTPSEKLD